MNRSSKKSSNKAARSAADKAGPKGKETEKSAESDPPKDPLTARTERYRVEGHRETVEAFVVAFILALLFRAFLAEAFVIPTGSMAPTLMGAHKDIECQRCKTCYRSGASSERKGPRTLISVVASACPNCRSINPLDLKNNSNHSTFNGDRILVSKFSYIFRDPDRWDVIVFKYPGNPKQNYIKRLVGLPGEIVTIRHGDVFVRPLGSEADQQRVLRKPPERLLSMRHLVYDTNHQSPELIRSGFPSRWQPWQESATAPPDDSWQIQRDESGLRATVVAGDSGRFHWLRYFHRWPEESDWRIVDQGGSLADIDPYSSRLITDFYSYNALVTVSSDVIYDEVPEIGPGRSKSWGRIGRMVRSIASKLNGGYSKGKFKDSYDSGGSIDQFGDRIRFGNQRLPSSVYDGMHWVGDLILEADVETSADANELVLEIVEAGIRYRCQIDLSNGVATFHMNNGENLSFVAEDGSTTAPPSAATDIRAGERCQLRFTNCDDQLLLWVDDKLVTFDVPTTYDARQLRKVEDQYPRYSTEHPLDAAPVGLAVRGGSATVHQLKIDRDKYYIATNDNNGMHGLTDYDFEKLAEWSGRRVSNTEIQQLFQLREHWEDLADWWRSREEVEFPLGEDQFFPMGDNSPESLDARCWARPKGVNPFIENLEDDYSDASFVPRNLLVGKALVVFWPHSWNGPIPFWPNYERMKLIR